MNTISRSVLAVRQNHRFALFSLQLLVAFSALLTFPLHAQEELLVDYRHIVPGLDYANVRMQNWNTNEPWSIHIARLDLSRKDLRFASMLSQNKVFDLAPISVQAKGVSKKIGTPLVAINCDFCVVTKDHPYRGTPRGLDILEGQLITAPYRYTLWVNDDKTVHFGNVDSKLTATLPEGNPFAIGMNQECKSNKVVLFTHMMGPSTRATNFLELVLEDPAQKPLSWRAGQKYSLRVKAINPDGDSALSKTDAVLTFGPKVSGKAKGIKPGDDITLDLATSADLSKAVTGIGCIFPLIENGKILEKFESGKYLVLKHPRTAIGFNDKYFYMVVVDGRQKDLSMGMFPNELATFMKRLGCTEAMNLDGGGSSTFWMKGKVINSPSEKRERNLANGLVIVRGAR